MKNIPNIIYLNLGEDEDICDVKDFKTLVGVTWSEEKINSGDIQYIRADLANVIIDMSVESDKENKKWE